MNALDELKQAYAILELPEDATRDQVEQRYYLLLKKARSKQVDLAEINRAYNLIVGHESEKASPQEKQSKTSYFFYYYKFHVIAAVIILLVAVFSVKGCIDRKNEEARKPPLDMTVTVFGNFYSADNTDKQLAANLLALMPDWKRIDVTVAYVPKDLTNPQDMALQQKGMLIMATEKMDLMILDRHNFDMFSRQGAFVPLDSLDIWPDLQGLSDRMLNSQTEDDPSSRPYGIDISGNPAFKGTNVELTKESMILALRTNSPHPDKSLQLMKSLAANKLK